MRLVPRREPEGHSRGCHDRREDSARRCRHDRDTRRRERSYRDSGRSFERDRWRGGNDGNDQGRSYSRGGDRRGEGWSHGRGGHGGGDWRGGDWRGDDQGRGMDQRVSGGYGGGGCDDAASSSSDSVARDASHGHGRSSGLADGGSWRRWRDDSVERGGSGGGAGGRRAGDGRGRCGGYDYEDEWWRRHDVH